MEENSSTAANEDSAINTKQSAETFSYENIISKIEDNTALLKAIEDDFQTKIKYDAAKEKAFDKLYEEMKGQEESANIKNGVLKPVLLDLLLFYDNIKKYITKYEAKKENNAPISAEDAIQDFQYIMGELIEVLYRQEVDIIVTNDNELFNSKLQKAIKSEESKNKNDNFKIIRKTKDGFLWKDKILRPQEVIIKRFSSKY